MHSPFSMHKPHGILWYTILCYTYDMILYYLITLALTDEPAFCSKRFFKRGREGGRGCGRVLGIEIDERGREVQLRSFYSILHMS